MPHNGMALQGRGLWSPEDTWSFQPILAWEMGSLEPELWISQEMSEIWISHVKCLILNVGHSFRHI